MPPHPYPIIANDLGANRDGTIYTNTGAIISIRSLFCEALDLLRIQDPTHYQRMLDDLKPNSRRWTEPGNVALRKSDLKSGKKPFSFAWKAFKANMNCSIEDKRYLISEIQGKDLRQLSLILHNRTLPESLITSAVGKPIGLIVDIDAYFAMTRGAIIKDAANIKAKNGGQTINSAYFTLEVPT